MKIRQSLFAEKNASIQREINMIIEAAQNIIDHLKYLLNEKNKIVDKYTTNIIDSEKNMGQESTETT